MINQNLLTLRKRNKYSQEEVAEKIHVSRQAVAKWENGETTPDIENANALAKLYNVTLDELVNHKDNYNGTMIPPKGKHFFGSVVMNERGQIVIPKKARELFQLKPGDSLLLLGDEDQGLGIVKANKFFEQIACFSNMVNRKKDD